MMETTTLTVIYIQPGDWAGYMDLSDTYFHVQIHPSSQIFLRLYEQRGFPLRVIPFGILTVPRVQPHDDCIRFLRMKGSLIMQIFRRLVHHFDRNYLLKILRQVGRRSLRWVSFSTQSHCANEFFRLWNTR